MKLKIARITMIILFFLVFTFTKKNRYRWMLRYLKGKGGQQVIPYDNVREILETLYRISGKQPGNHCLNHSLWYDGHGFKDRPELFYMIGGFTFEVKHLDSGRYSISLEDQYDWHPNKDGHWFTSPLPKWVQKVGAKLFGKEYFPSCGFPSGEPGISNEFFAALQAVGAKEFTSVFEGEFEDMIFCPVCNLPTEEDDYVSDTDRCHWCEEDSPSLWEQRFNLIFENSQELWYTLSEDEYYWVFKE